jgi:membrane associated rhomboid family serine protease
MGIEMLRPKRQWQRDMTFGGRIPWAVGLLLTITVVLSLLTAIGGRAAPLFDRMSLQPAAVWHGQLWRLLTWPFVEGSPFGLILACLSLYWFGPPLADRLGSPRFLSGFGGTMLVAGGGTCLIALVDREVMGSNHLGSWAMTTALVVLWGLSFPDNVVRIYFVLPIRGFWFAWGTVALTVIYCAYTGWAGFLPELLAEGTVLAWFYRKSLSRRWAMARGPSEPRRPARPRDERRGIVVDLRTGEPPDPEDRGGVN